MYLQCVLEAQVARKPFNHAFRCGRKLHNALAVTPVREYVTHFGSQVDRRRFQPEFIAHNLRLQECAGPLGHLDRGMGRPEPRGITASALEPSTLGRDGRFQLQIHVHQRKGLGGGVDQR